MRAALWCIVLVSLALYLFALVLWENSRFEQARGGFESFSVGAAWFTMFRCVVYGDCTPAEALFTDNKGPVWSILYCLLVVFVKLGLFYTLAAVYVEQMVASAKLESQAGLRKRLLDEENFASQVMRLVELVTLVHADRQKNLAQEPPTVAGQTATAVNDQHQPVDTQITITPQLFNELRSHEEFHEILGALDVSSDEQLNLFEMLDVDGGGTIGLDEFVIGIKKLRGNTRRSDIVGVSLVVRYIQAEIESIVEGMKEQSAAIRVIRNALGPAVRNDVVAGRL